jgi:general secretion pathway protein D
MKRTLTLLAAAAAMTLPLVVPAQSPFVTGAQPGGGGGRNSRPAWEEFKLSPTKKIQLSFRNASADAIIDLLSKQSGITIIKDPALNTPMTVTTPKAVPLKDAFAVFNSALGLRGFEMTKEGSILVIKRREQGRGGGMGGFDPSMLANMFQAPQNELKVYRIKFAASSEVARVVNEVFVQQQQMSLGGLGAMMGGFAMGGGGNQGGRFGRQGGGGGGGFNFGGLGGGQQATVRASSDDFSNSVIVNAPKDKQFEVESLIEEIDKQTDQPQTTKLYKVEFAVATDLQSVIQGVLQSNAPRGRGGPTAQRQGGGGFFGALFGGNNQTQGSVTADDRSNTLVVTTTADNQKIVEGVLKELDQEVEIANTTFVFPLQNARADSVATILQQAFGNRGNTGGNRGGGTTQNRNTGTNNRNTGNRNNAAGGGGLGGNAGRASDGSDIPVDQLDDGTLMTDVYVQQGGFRFGGQFGQGGGGQQNRTGQSGLARGADGRLVNQRDLTNQVTVIPDPNTNSLVIVTTPDNVQLLQQLLGQLDKIPEQVMIETMIVEATLDSTTKLGVEWTVAQPTLFNQPAVTGNARSDFGLQNANPALQGFRYAISGGNISTFINALKSDDKFEVLSTPRIFTSNNVEAEINISQSIPYVLSQREDANGNLTFNYAFQDVGIVLTVTPRITANGYVTMDVTQTANDLQGYTSFNAPIVNQRQAETTVSVKDGETIVLGGIMRTEVRANTKKLPILGDIPLLGNLFKSTSRQDVKTELLVFLRPVVVRDEAEARTLQENTTKQLAPGLQKKVNNNIQQVNKGQAGTSTKSEKGQTPPPATTGGTDPKTGDKQKP